MRSKTKNNPRKTCTGYEAVTENIFSIKGEVLIFFFQYKYLLRTCVIFMFKII